MLTPLGVHGVTIMHMVKLQGFSVNLPKTSLLHITPNYSEFFECALCGMSPISKPCFKYEPKILKSCRCTTMTEIVNPLPDAAG